MKLQIYLLIGFTLFLNLFDGQSQKTSLLSDKALNDTAMIIKYNENGKDIFTDIESNKYNSLNKIIQARYGSQIKYFEKY